MFISVIFISVIRIFSSMSSKLEPVMWLRDTGHIGIHGEADVRTYVRMFMTSWL